MKSTLLFAFAAVLFCGQVASGQPGSYQVAPSAKPEVQAAASFAVMQQSKSEGIKLELKEVLRADQQVVAGMNYRLQLLVVRDGTLSMAEAVIFRGLDSHLEFKSWHWLNQPAH